MWSNKNLVLFGVTYNVVKLYFIHDSICKYNQKAYTHLKRDALSLIADKRIRELAKKNNIVTLADL